LFGQFSVVLLCQLARGIADMKLEHSLPGFGAGEWDIDAFLKSRDVEIQYT
jgi:hypothetical protein